MLHPMGPYDEERNAQGIRTHLGNCAHIANHARFLVDFHVTPLDVEIVVDKFFDAAVLELADGGTVNFFDAFSMRYSRLAQQSQMQGVPHESKCTQVVAVDEVDARGPKVIYLDRVYH